MTPTTFPYIAIRKSLSLFWRSASLRLAKGIIIGGYLPVDQAVSVFDDLLKATRKQQGLRIGAVKYLALAEIKKKRLASEDLPFLKRYAFEHEDEFRMIYGSETTKLSKLDIAIPLSCIDRITVSPWIHPVLFRYVKQMLRSIEGCGTLTIVRSTLIGNEEWKTRGGAAR